MDGYFTTLGGRTLNPGREVSGLGLGGLQEVAFNGRLRVGRLEVAAKQKCLRLASGSAPFCSATHFWNTRFSCFQCGTPKYWEPDVLGQGGLGGVPGKGSGVVAGVVGRDQAGEEEGFFGE